MTLLEVLVALAILGLLLVTLTTLLHLTLSVSAARMRRSEVTAEATPALELLDALIGDARPPVFDGRPDRLSLVAPLGAGFADAGGLQLIRLRQEDNALSIAWAPYGDASLPMPRTAGAAVLLPSVSELRFRYFGPAAIGAPPAWRDTWTGMPALPLLVELELARGDGEGRRELIVATHVTGAAPANPR